MKKKHIIHSVALLLGLCLAGCKESLPDNFGAIEGIYFYNQLTDRTVVDSAAYTFIYEDADVLEVPVRLQLVGRAAAQPRAVDVRVTSQDAEEGTDYTLGGEAVLPAGSVSFDYVVTLKRTDILKEQTKNLLLELRANENFIIPFTSQVQSGGDTVSAVTFKINFSDQFTAPPAGWRSLFVGPFSAAEIRTYLRRDGDSEGRFQRGREDHRCQMALHREPDDQLCQGSGEVESRGRAL